jgi:hypothetical protein
LLNELKGRKEAIKDQKLIKREALTDGTMETLLDGMTYFSKRKNDLYDLEKNVER